MSGFKATTSNINVIKSKNFHVNNYPLTVKQQSVRLDRSSTRACTMGRLVEIGKTILITKTSVSDAERL